MAKKKKQDEIITAADIAAGIIGISIGVTAFLFTRHIIKHRRNPLWDEIRKQPVITEDAEFEVLPDEKKEIKLIEDKPNE